VAQYKPDVFCIPHRQYRQDHGYVTQTLAAGQWSVRVRATSLAGNGSWTPHVYFDITKPVGQSFFCDLFNCSMIPRSRQDIASSKLNALVW